VPGTGQAQHSEKTGGFQGLDEEQGLEKNVVAQRVAPLAGEIPGHAFDFAMFFAAALARQNALTANLLDKEPPTGCGLPFILYASCIDPQSSAPPPARQRVGHLVAGVVPTG